MECTGVGVVIRQGVEIAGRGIHLPLATASQSWLGQHKVKVSEWGWGWGWGMGMGRKQKKKKKEDRQKIIYSSRFVRVILAQGPC